MERQEPPVIFWASFAHMYEYIKKETRKGGARESDRARERRKESVRESESASERERARERGTDPLKRTDATMRVVGDLLGLSRLSRVQRLHIHIEDSLAHIQVVSVQRITIRTQKYILSMRAHILLFRCTSEEDGMIGISCGARGKLRGFSPGAADASQSQYFSPQNTIFFIPPTSAWWCCRGPLLAYADFAQKCCSVLHRLYTRCTDHAMYPPRPPPLPITFFTFSLFAR